MIAFITAVARTYWIRSNSVPQATVIHYRYRVKKRVWVAVGWS